MVQFGITIQLVSSSKCISGSKIRENIFDHSPMNRLLSKTEISRTDQVAESSTVIGGLLHYRSGGQTDGQHGLEDYEKEMEKAEKLSFKVPHLTEEETQSDHMPLHLRCDACLAVAYQITVSIENQRKKKATLKLQESEVIDVLEKVCSKNFEEYGLKQVNGENRLSGPGLETQHVMGMIQMGGRWPHRLKELCHYYVGDAGEMEIYETFLEGTDALKNYFCYRSGIYGHCSRKIPEKVEF